MTRRTPERRKHLSSRLDLAGIVGAQRLGIAKRRHRAGFRRRFLGGHVHGHRGDVAHRELAAHAVAIDVRVLAGAGLLPHELVGHQAHGASRRADREVAQDRDVALPPQRPDHQVGIHADDLRRVDADHACWRGGRRDRAEAGPFRCERSSDLRARRRLGGRGGLVARGPQILGHLLRQQLEDAVAEDRRHRSHVERRGRALLRADDGAVRQAGRSRKGLGMALAARL